MVWGREERLSGLVGTASATAPFHVEHQSLSSTPSTVAMVTTITNAVISSFLSIGEFCYGRDFSNGAGGFQSMSAEYLARPTVPRFLLKRSRHVSQIARVSVTDLPGQYRAGFRNFVRR